MRFPRLVLVLAVLTALATTARAQDSAQAADQRAQQAQVRAMLEQIVRERPPQAEAAARAMLRQLQLNQQMLDSLGRSRDQYWQEVAQLTVQQQMLSQMVSDSMRQKLMAQMFGAEARARSLQRAYRETADSGQERAIRERLQAVLERHLAAEDSLRSLEVAEVERRLAQVRAETVRRRRDRAELVRQMVQEVLRDAKRPE